MTVHWPDDIQIDEQYLPPLLSADETLSQLNLPQPWTEQWQDVWAPLAALLATLKEKTGVPVIGIHGGQGSGKSTLSGALCTMFREVFGWNTVVLSIDDLYLTHQQRQTLARERHPLLATRGVPGTHDAQLGMDLIRQLKALEADEVLHIPAFDKASDDRLPEDQWHTVSGPVDMILFEGWCVGCHPVDVTELQQPFNKLEAEEDTDGRWRSAVNDELAASYHDWFSMIDFLLMLKVPDMKAVLNWRTQQETGNKQAAAGNGPDRSLDSARLERFIQHYQRLTEQALKYMPGWADLILQQNHKHQVESISMQAKGDVL